MTAGQERLILAAFDAGFRLAVIVKEFRVSRSTVQHVITDAKRERPCRCALAWRKLFQNAKRYEKCPLFCAGCIAHQGFAHIFQEEISGVVEP